MAGSVNKVILVGNLGADPEVRRTQDGRPIVNLRVATSESWRDKNTGERREKTEWHRVVIFSEGLAKIAEQYLKKGSKVYLEGALQTRKWQDKYGQDRYSTEVVLQGFNSALTMLDRAGGGGGQAPTATSAPARPRHASANLRWPAPAASATTWTTRFHSSSLGVSPLVAHPRESGGPGRQFLIQSPHWRAEARFPSSPHARWFYRKVPVTVTRARHARRRRRIAPPARRAARRADATARYCR